VALLGDLTPDFDNLKGWYKAFSKVAQNKEENNGFLEASWEIFPRAHPSASLAKSVAAPIRLLIFLSFLEAHHNPE